MAFDLNYFDCFYTRGNKGRPKSIYVNDGISTLNALFFNAQLDTLTSMVEQKINVNTFNSNHMIYDLCGGYHATYELCKYKMWIIMMNLGITIIVLINATLVGVILIIMVGIIEDIIIIFHVLMIFDLNVPNMNINHLGN